MTARQGGMPPLAAARVTAREVLDHYRVIDVNDLDALAEAYSALHTALGRLLDAHDREEGL